MPWRGPLLPVFWRWLLPHGYNPRKHGRHRQHTGYFSQSRPKIQILPDFFTQPELTRRQQCRAPHRCGGGPDKVITLAQCFPVARQTAIRLRQSARFLTAAIGVDNTVGRNKDITFGIFLHDGFDILQIIRMPGIISIQKADVLPRRPAQCPCCVQQIRPGSPAAQPGSYPNAPLCMPAKEWSVEPSSTTITS